ncbi:tRNA dihydrouridine synthase DusB [Corticibacter populi]|uniref:tRNA-dihydrouridine synthase B n=1 Tax=Corticibacter populi TaxID=1550736 RepID=A0A3M6QK21_9BURK|nr:tRNA dihydrouridine synthase DusB [Corticibacter populi]RMX03446.1 tRNA dihydrouridine synthase DusB [Corticibacter populi]RZS29883.1 tRNA-U20-dihydrouridine synthase [Corticibacter populi]
MQIGPFTPANRLFVAPMAGVTDRPFRMLCRRLGAGHAVSEMVTSRPDLFQSLKTSRRANHAGEPGPIAVQIAGTDAAMMAEAARYNIERGAQIIDINMGCPAKKVCNKWAGSALMQNEPLAVAIAEAVVAVCAPHGVPVTLKMRTGWSQQQRNATVLARRFEEAGIQMLTVHGRTREQGYRGAAEYATIAAVKQAVRIPVVANGDIGSGAKARQVLAATGADALMIGRAAQGRPWIFREIAHFLETGQDLPAPSVVEVRQWLLDHLLDHYQLYGEASGVRSARKHIGWYLHGVPGGDAFRRHMNTIEEARLQWQAVADFLGELAAQHEQWPATIEDNENRIRNGEPAGAAAPARQARHDADAVSEQEELSI